ncbi:MAG: hypothetical protein LBR53_13680 [Deltaproteobacteria bacterium]|jgi:hypothetical protein|nr:hypothetical protein [Deltaproteobacteria bacterium]
MTTSEEKLKSICRELLTLDENEIIKLLPVYHRRLDDFQSITEWEEATVMFFMINGLRIKNIQLPDKIRKLNGKPAPRVAAAPSRRVSTSPRGKPSLRLVK